MKQKMKLKPREPGHFEDPIQHNQKRMRAFLKRNAAYLKENPLPPQRDFKADAVAIFGLIRKVHRLMVPELTGLTRKATIKDRLAFDPSNIGVPRALDELPRDALYDLEIMTKEISEATYEANFSRNAEYLAETDEELMELRGDQEREFHQKS